MNKQARNFGIDMLRIISMLGVVFLHVLGHGGILNLSLSPAKFSMVWFLEILAYPAVNCFVLISGFVGYKGERFFPKLKNIISLLFTVLFYSVIIVVVFMLFSPEPVGMKELVTSLFPTIMGRYWFFTAYFGLFLLSPFLNALVSQSNLKQDIIFLIVFSLFSIVSVLRDTFSLLGGYSVIWFVLIYLIGAIIKKYEVNKLLSQTKWCIIVLCAFIVTWLSKIVLYFLGIPFLQNQSGILIDYTSPTIVIMAIGLLALFSNITCHSFTKVISFIATSAFSVYLIHDNFFVRTYLITKIHTMVDGFNFLFLALSIVGSVIVIFLSCIWIDKIRICLFKLIRIDTLSKHIENFLKTKINTICKKIESKQQTKAE